MKLGHRFVVGYKIFKYGSKRWRRRFMNNQAPIQGRLEVCSPFKEYMVDKSLIRMLKRELRA